MRSAIVLLALLVPGCVAEPHARVRSIPLTEPAFDSVLPAVEDLPAGFVIGLETDYEPSGGPQAPVAGLGRVFDYTRANSTVQHMVQASVMRYASTDDVAAAFVQYQSGSMDGEAILVDANLTLRRNVIGTLDDPASYWNHTIAFGRTDLYVVFVGESARGEAPITDTAGLVRGMLHRLEAAG